MRLRGRKGIRESLVAQPDLVVLNPKEYKGRWHEFFGNHRPIRVELGMGKGRFISEMSRRHPDMNFIGVDMYDELIRRAAEKARRLWNRDGGSDGEAPPNLALALGNIEYIEDFFGENEVDRIFLNFSDPWPKVRHAKRRLSHSRFIEKYVRLLNSQGEIHQKTDSRELFEFSLNSYLDCGLKLRNISLDLHGQGVDPAQAMTEYEAKFVERGLNIYRCEVLVGSDALAQAVAVGDFNVVGK